MKNSFREVQALPAPQADYGGVSILFENFRLVLKLHDTEKVFVVQIAFTNVAAYSFASPEHAKGCAETPSDTIVECLESRWIKEELRRPSLWPFPVRHFRVLIDDVGFVDVAGDECVVTGND